MTRIFTFANGAFSFVNTTGSGWERMQFELNGQLSSQLQCVKNATDISGGEVVLEGANHRETIRFVVNTNRQALTVSRTITNSGVASLPFLSISDGLLDKRSAIRFAGKFSAIDYYKLRYFHASNIGTEQFPRFRVEHPYVRCIPYEPVCFNQGEANCLPAFGMASNREYSTILVEGDLNQTQFDRIWELGLEGVAEDSRVKHCKGIQRYTLSSGFTLEPGQSVEVSRVFYQVKEDSHPQLAFDDYISELGKHHTFQGCSSRMLREGVFCTWNYGTFGNITEELILKRANALADNVPNCTHFLIDDGYQALRNTYGNGNAGIDSFYPIPAEGYDRTKFRNGMKVVADGIRRLGLKPCIWLSPKVYLESTLAKEKPEWLLKDKNGSVELIGKSSFLDLSHPEAREFYLKVLDALFVEWGFEGVKYDFMTQWFLLDKIRYDYNSGVEWRDFAFSEIRKRIGTDGLFMTCIAFSKGNPFPGLNADCYRAGFDIHDGTWDEQVRACSGTLAQTLIEGRKTFLLNMDSVGFGDIAAHEQRFRFNWCFITQGIIEIGGKLEDHTPEQFAVFNKLLENADRGNKVISLDERVFTGEPLPEILQVKYTDDGPMKQAGVKQHVAFFNWSDEPKLISVSGEKAGIDTNDSLRDFWTGKDFSRNGDFISVELSAHASALYEVRL